MILIADSGSTKTDWILTGGNNPGSRYRTLGYNPCFTGSTEIVHSLTQSLLPKLNPSVVEKVYFYGAGCSTPANVAIVYNAISRCFVNSEIVVEHDMLAAARALLGNTGGFAAIMGTGSNTCIYNGTEIEKSIDPLGYILGDEGSGSDIGKKILRDFMRNNMPLELKQDFSHDYPLSSTEIFNFIYNEPTPNRFLASFCVFANKHKKHEYIRDIVKMSFRNFFTNMVGKYSGYHNYSFNCAGSVGYIFMDILKEVVESHGMKMGKLIPSPILNLAHYHLSHVREKYGN